MEVEKTSSVNLSSAAPVNDTKLPKRSATSRSSSHTNHADGAKADGPHGRRSQPAESAGASPATSRQEQAAATKKKPRVPKTSKQEADSKHTESVGKGHANTTNSVKCKMEPQIEVVKRVPRERAANLHQNSNPPQASAEAAKTSQNGLLMAKQKSVDQPPQVPQVPDSATQTLPTAPRSTPMYDPVRGYTSQRSIESYASLAPAPGPVQSPPRSGTSRQSTSPISSIIDHAPGLLQPSAPSPLRTSVSNGETGLMPRPHEASQPPQSTQSGTTPGAMDLDPPPADLANGKTTAGNKRSAPDAAPRSGSPKPARVKEQPVPKALPTGSGLLSATLFGGGGGGGESGLDSNENKVTGPNIVLHIDLNDPKNKVINFARLAEEKYGFAALFPRQAAQKERLARVAAAGAALERSASASKHGGTSAGDSGEDDVSVDIERDSDNDGDVNMGGLNGTNEPANSGTDGPEPKRRRRKKVEEYDQDDPFIDDSEQLWETQAAASKDGFFVYSGPLVPEGEKATVERADGSVRRGRGGRARGAGTGARGGRGGRAAATATSAPATDADAPAARPTTGPGSRGGGAARKPRAKKTEKEKQQPQPEREKEKRENGDIEIAPAAAPSTSTSTSAPILLLPASS